MWLSGGFPLVRRRNVVRTVDGEFCLVFPFEFSMPSHPCFGFFEKSLDVESNEERCGILGRV